MAETGRGGRQVVFAGRWRRPGRCHDAESARTARHYCHVARSACSKVRRRPAAAASAACKWGNACVARVTDLRISIAVGSARHAYLFEYQLARRRGNRGKSAAGTAFRSLVLGMHGLKAPPWRTAREHILFSCRVAQIKMQPVAQHTHVHHPLVIVSHTITGATSTTWTRLGATSHHHGTTWSPSAPEQSLLYSPWLRCRRAC